MNLQEEITKLLMKSYDKGVEGATQEAIVALEKTVAVMVAAEREACIKLVHAGTGEPVQTKTLLILQKDRKRIEDAIRARGPP